MIALIDMDLVCFRSAASAEDEPVGIAVSRMKDLFEGIQSKVGATSYRAFLTGPSNFRKTINPQYKANRTAPKPKHLIALQKYALDKLGAEWAPDTLEADDALSIHQDKVGGTTTICSLDKDMLQVPGKHFQWAIGTLSWSRPDNFVEQTELEGLRLFYEQCIKGDSSDNVKGIPGLGEVKARKALAGLTTEQAMFNKVHSLSLIGKGNFLMDSQCLWLLRHEGDSYATRYEKLLNAQVQK
jgi:5'-3' exonuclease